MAIMPEIRGTADTEFGVTRAVIKFTVQRDAFEVFRDPAPLTRACPNRPPRLPEPPRPASDTGPVHRGVPPPALAHHRLHVTKSSRITFVTFPSNVMVSLFSRMLSTLPSPNIG